LPWGEINETQTNGACFEGSFIIYPRVALLSIQNIDELENAVKIGEDYMAMDECWDECCFEKDLKGKGHE
jgi:hypothetical protein